MSSGPVSAVGGSLTAIRQQRGALSRMQLTADDRKRLRDLEESLWRPATRFDSAYMNRVLAPDFFEFGRSGRVHSRDDVLSAGRRDIPARLPLPGLSVRGLAPDIALVTYMSDVDYASGHELANRSSIWSRSESGWQLRFHQGTAIAEAVAAIEGAE